MVGESGARAGGLNFDPASQKMYGGSQNGLSYIALDAGRLRFLGGSTNHWGGWCAPLHDIDFEARDWVPHSGWPIAQRELEPHYAAAQYQMGSPVSNEQLQPGDLVFFRGLGHMGMYIGGGNFIHAPHTGDVVKISALSDPYYVANWVGAKRVL